VREGDPIALIDELRGRVWTKAIARDELEACRAKYEVISTRLFAGRTIVHVLADADPGEGFSPVASGLEDVYFSTLFADRRTAIAA
jgi:ABC-2 type transport system ATP-binding protein